jgi:hypothetical protein
MKEIKKKPKNYNSNRKKKRKEKKRKEKKNTKIRLNGFDNIPIISIVPSILVSSG